MGNNLTQASPPSIPFSREVLDGSNDSRKVVRMERLRKSFRESFRKKKEHIPESSKPHQWQADEHAVRVGSCAFPVKYLGCVEVFESRGMQVCEEALKVLRSSRRRPLKGILYITGDGLRVVDEETKGLIVDQTIEKVSFCAPDRSHERGFSYICRDGTTRRWMCHGFHAGKDSGERLSHAVGCAFAVCLERKQKRDKDTNNVTMNFDNKTSTFTRCGSFRQSTLTERLKDPQVAKPSEPPPLKTVHNPYAIERPHATPQLIQRQGSFRGFSGLNQASPFKRQLSLRQNDLPSNLERQRAHSLGSNEMFEKPSGAQVAPIPEVINQLSPDTISEMCKELSMGLTLLSSNEGPALSPTSPITDQIEKLSQLGNKENAINTPKQSSALNSTNVPAKTLGNSIKNNTSQVASIGYNTPIAPPRKSSPMFSQLRSHSVGNSENKINQYSRNQHNSHITQKDTLKTSSLDSSFSELPHDPFDAEWASLAARAESNLSKSSTNPFSQTSHGINI